MTDLHAAIDIGTNSMHLVVARTGANGGFEVLTTLKETTRLGSGAGEMKSLSPDAIDRGIAALQRMVGTAHSMGAEVVAVATSAVREAHNRDEFLDRARDEVGVDVEVISGSEEARLIHLGVLQALPVYGKRMMLVDIGGGSTELLVGIGITPIEARSMKLGAIRLTDRFFGRNAGSDSNQPPDPAAVDECRRWVRSALASVAHELGGHQPELFVGSSGTIANIAEMCAAARGDELTSLNGASFSSKELSALVVEIVSSSASERLTIAALDAKRNDIIVAGVLLLEGIFDVFDIDEMMVSGLALREGVLLDRFGDVESDDRPVRELRRANVERLTRNLDPDPAHAQHTADLALQLFDRTTKLHGLDEHHRELLEAAAMLHNVGLFVSHSAHHKHSYYVIRNSDQLTGFTDHEIETIALVARYHRKGHPAKKHGEFSALSKRDRKAVMVLAGLLRVAIGLDRRHAGNVATVRVHLSDDRIEIEPVAAEPALELLDRKAPDLDLEVYSANERSDLLAAALAIDVVVRERDPIGESEFLSS